MGLRDILCHNKIVEPFNREESAPLSPKRRIEMKLFKIQYEFCVSSVIITRDLGFSLGDILEVENSLWVEKGREATSNWSPYPIDVVIIRLIFRPENVQGIKRGWCVLQVSKIEN